MFTGPQFFCEITWRQQNVGKKLVVSDRLSTGGAGPSAKLLKVAVLTEHDEVGVLDFTNFAVMLNNLELRIA